MNGLQNHNNVLEMVTDVNSQNNSWQSDSISPSPYFKLKKILNKEIYTNGTQAISVVEGNYKCMQS